MKARVIPAFRKRKLPASGMGEETPARIRVCAYCRVSTDNEEQESSYEIQCTHYENLISQNPSWELAGIYADEGISGTSTQGRDQFNRMILDCEAGRIDLILTKSISRFARNTLDCLNYIRKLKALEIPVLFEKEGINTMDARGELLLTIMASIAQQESESISRNVQMGVRYHYQEGRVCAGHQNMLGYTRTSEGSLAIVPEEAVLVRRIFREYLDGYSPKHIGERLRAEKVTDRRGILRSWSIRSIQYILRNEKYMGDLLLQKYYTEDFLSKKIRPNKGEIQQYYVEGSHAPILPREIYYRVQTEIERRSSSRTRYSHRIGLSGKLFCSECGSPLYRVKAQGKRHTRWRCASKIRRASVTAPCEASSLLEKDLQEGILTAFNLLPGQERALETMLGHLETALAAADSILEKRRQESACLPDKGEEEPAEALFHPAERRYASLLKKREDLFRKKREITDLLERIEYMKGKKAEGIEDSFGGLLPEAACRESEDFYRRTRKAYETGPLREYKEDMVIRFVKYVEAGQGIRVCFKAGILIDPAIE